MSSFICLRLALVFCLFTGMVTGASWVRIVLPLEGTESFDCIQFTDTKTGFILVGGATLLKTVDGGEQWVANKIVLPDSAGSAADEATALRIWFAGKEHGWAVGGIGKHGAIWETRDAGLRWKLRGEWQPTGAEEYDRSYGADVHFSDISHGWVVGSDSGKAMIWATQDGGSTWETQYAGDAATGNFQRVWFTDNEVGWALGSLTNVQTTSGGVHWRTKKFDGLPNEVSAPSVNSVWLAAGWGLLYHGSTRGADLKQMNLSRAMRDVYLAWVTFTSREVGWVSGSKGEVFRTRDAGRRWQDFSIPKRLLGIDERTYDMVATRDAVYVLVAPSSLLLRKIR